MGGFLSTVSKIALEIWRICFFRRRYFWLDNLLCTNEPLVLSKLKNYTWCSHFEHVLWWDPVSFSLHLLNYVYLIWTNKNTRRWKNNKLQVNIKNFISTINSQGPRRRATTMKKSRTFHPLFQNIKNPWYHLTRISHTKIVIRHWSNTENKWLYFSSCWSIRKLEKIWTLNY